MITMSGIRRKPSKRQTVKRLQDEYLRTGSQKALEQMYRDLVNLGLTIAKSYEYPDDPIAVHDIASNVIIRLMEKQVPIIKGGVSGYMKQALYFYFKFKGQENIDDYEDIETSMDNGPSCDEEIDSIISALGIDTTTELGSLVEMTMRGRVSWRRVWNKLGKGEFRDRYEDLMMEVYDYVKETMQGNGVLEV